MASATDAPPGCAPARPRVVSVPRSVGMQDQVLAHWREVVSKLPPDRRQAWLKTPEAIAGLGARRCADILQGIRLVRSTLEASVPGQEWLEAWGRTGAMLPAFDANHQGGGLRWRGGWTDSITYRAGDGVRYRGANYAAIAQSTGISPRVNRECWRPTDARQHAARMVLSRCKTRIGFDGEPTWRFTPPQAVAVEDELDALTPLQADFYQSAPSPSAVVIRRIGELGAKEI